MTEDGRGPTKRQLSEVDEIHGSAEPRFCFLIARPRSGTTVFKRMLETHPEIVSLGEIFTESVKRSYFDFLKELVAREPDALLPSRSTGVFLQYLESCRSHALRTKPRCKIIVLDIKYDQAHLICEPWWTLEGLPRLLFLMRERKWKVIDLHRQDIFRLVISNQIAIQTKIYHSNSLKPGERHSASAHIDPQQLVFNAKNTKAAYSAISNHFKGRKEYRLAYYEDMFADASGSSFSEAFAEGIAKFLGVDNVFNLAPKLQKLLSEDVYSYISNADEIRALVEGGSLGSL